MRALCGSIIAAGALIGLGLTALGFGTRFGGITTVHPDGTTFAGVYYGTPSMIIALVVLIAAVAIGLGIAFVGLAFHHERRTWERQSTADGNARPRVGV
ncbi:MAG TPA: hypothetical protein VL371_21990 [Gemmataceae bacterium]|jgi:hypothetical protein|nr:hypothetical protein [Gemmataceae bacterium]